jgi:hypothetical protein
MSADIVLNGEINSRASLDEHTALMKKNAKSVEDALPIDLAALLWHSDRLKTEMSAVAINRLMKRAWSSFFVDSSFVAEEWFDKVFTGLCELDENGDACAAQQRVVSILLEKKKFALLGKCPFRFKHADAVLAASLLSAAAGVSELERLAAWQLLSTLPSVSIPNAESVVAAAIVTLASNPSFQIANAANNALALHLPKIKSNINDQIRCLVEKLSADSVVPAMKLLLDKVRYKHEGYFSRDVRLPIMLMCCAFLKIVARIVFLLRDVLSGSCRSRLETNRTTMLLGGRRFRHVRVMHKRMQYC